MARVSPQPTLGTRKCGCWQDQSLQSSRLGRAKPPAYKHTGKIQFCPVTATVIGLGWGPLLQL